MTAQNVSAVVGNASMSRVFTKTDATDGVFESNNLTSSQSGVNLGLEMPGVTITSVQAVYTEGAAIWRIIDATTNRVSRYGMASKDGYTCASSSSIPAYVVKSTDLLQIYPVAVNSTPQNAEVLAWVVTNAGVEPFGVTVTTTEATEMKSLITSQTLGDYAFGKRVQKVCIQAEDGALLDEVTVLDQTGGTVYTAYGTYRMPTAGGANAYTNGEYMTALTIAKGWTIKVAVTASA